MNLFDDIFAGTTGLADNLIDMFGDDAVIHYRDRTYDPAAGSHIDVVTDYTMKAAPPLQYKTQDYVDTETQRGDLYTLISASLLETIPGMQEEQLKKSTIELNGLTFQIVSVKTVYSGANIATYRIQLRK